MADTLIETGNDLVTFAPKTPVDVLQSAEKFDELISDIRKAVRDHVPDLTSEKGRKAIASLAYKVTRTKTALDNAGKDLNAEKRKEIDAVDDVRRKVRAELDALAVEARKPLDAWEAAEADRKAKVDRIIILLDATFSAPGDTIEQIAASIAEIEAMEFDADLFREWLEIAVKKKLDLLAYLRGAHDRATKAEADAAELLRLRKDAADREAAEAKRIAEETRQRDAREAAEVAERLAAQAEAKRVEDARIAEEKRQKDIADAADAARAEERAKADREAAEKVAAANAEADRLRKAESDRLAEWTQAESDRKAREADQAHRSAILKAAKEAIIEHGGVTEAQAKAIVLAIKGGIVPNITLSF